jgi:CheY-like chemotaxis protein
MVTAAQPGKRVLLVEDDCLLREMASLVLAGEGYRVATASNGKDAIHRLRHFERPNLILLDLMMPGMDGWQFRQELKKDANLASIPVVVVSAADDLEKEASSLGAAAYLQKPVDGEKLIEAVRRCCQ